jgi:hypothetical protein
MIALTQATDVVVTSLITAVMITITILTRAMLAARQPASAE